MIGGLINGFGRFECDDDLDGRPIRVRFDWPEVSSSAALWEGLLARRRRDMAVELVDDHDARRIAAPSARLGTSRAIL